MTGMTNPGRRNLLRGRPVSAPAPVRPPWTATESEFTDACTACGKCTESCEESIIVAGSGGLPEVNFQLGECTFCGSCADVCPESLFDQQNREAFSLTLTISEQCLASRNVVCETCRDSCDASAIRFTPRLGSVARPQVDLAACTGCGACVQDCPEAAISLSPQKQETTIHEH